MDNVRIIGSSHIASESVRKVRKAVGEWKPDIVALELDPRRLSALLREEKRGIPLSAVAKLGIQGYLFALIAGWASRKLGNIVGTSPGDEMKEAYLLAQKNKLGVALIDRDIEITLRRFSRYFTWREKLRMLRDMATAVFNKKKVLEKYGSIDFSRVPGQKVIELVLEEASQKYPSLYKVLISERDEIMARNIMRLSSENPGKKILVVVGAGHVKGIRELLKKQPLVSYSFTFHQNP